MKRLTLALAILFSTAMPSWASFSRVVSVRVAASKVGGSVTNFPMWLTFTDVRFKSASNGGCAQSSSGYDIRPYAESAATTAYSFQLISYTASTGALSMWVKLPSADSTSGATFYLACGDPSLTTDGSTSGTWNSNFKLVLHLEAGLDVNDSTSNANNFTNSNATAATGKVGGAAAFNGTNAKVTKSGLTIPTTGSLLIWWKPNVANTNDRDIIRSYNASPLRLFDIDPYQDANIYSGWYNNGNDKRVQWAESGISSGTYYRLALTWTNSGTTTFYVNAVSKGTTASLNATWDTSGVTTSLGFDEQATHYSNIDLDEVQLLNTVVDQAWLTTDYNNQNSPSTFFTLGDERTVFVDSFDHYTDLTQKYSVAGGLNAPTISTLGKRTGLAGLSTATSTVLNAGTGIRYDLPVSAYILAFEADIYPTQWPDDGTNNWLAGTLFQTWKESTGTDANWSVSIRMPGSTDSGKICAYRNFSGGGTQLGCSSVVLTLNAWHKIKVKFKADTSVGYVLVDLDGSTVLNLTSQNTAAGPVEGINIHPYFGISNSGATAALFRYYLDNLQVYSTYDDAPIPADRIVKAFLPTANGTTNNFSRGGTDSGANWSQVNENPPDGDTAYLTSSTLNDIQLLAYSSSVGTGALNSASCVVLLPFIRATSAGPTIQGELYNSGTSLLSGTDKTLTTSYFYYPMLFDADASALPWTLSSAVLTEKGVKITTAGANVRLSQMAVEVVGGEAPESTSRPLVFTVQ